MESGIIPGRLGNCSCGPKVEMSPCAWHYVVQSRVWCYSTPHTQASNSVAGCCAAKVMWLTSCESSAWTVRLEPAPFGRSALHLRGFETRTNPKNPRGPHFLLTALGG